MRDSGVVLLKWSSLACIFQIIKYVYIYIYIHICVCVFIYVFLYNMMAATHYSSDGKKSANNTGDPSLIPGSGYYDVYVRYI